MSDDEALMAEVERRVAADDGRRFALAHVEAESTSRGYPVVYDQPVKLPDYARLLNSVKFGGGTRGVCVDCGASLSFGYCVQPGDSDDVACSDCYDSRLRGLGMTSE